MKKENYNVCGVMSGTSLDGVDLAHIQFAILIRNGLSKSLNVKLLAITKTELCAESA